jgi:hypothetical protein
MEGFYIISLHKYDTTLKPKLLSPEIKNENEFKYFKDISDLKITKIVPQIFQFVEVEDSSSYLTYDIESTAENFYFKFELNFEAFKDNLLLYYFETSDCYIVSEIIKLDTKFIYKIYKILQNPITRIPIYRKTIENVPDKVTFTNKRYKTSLKVTIKTKQNNLFRYLFTLPDIKKYSINFTLSEQNKKSIDSIYFSNTGLKIKPDNNINTVTTLPIACSKFKESHCNTKDCHYHFCKDCCSKIKKCIELCLNIIK